MLGWARINCLYTRPVRATAHIDVDFGFLIKSHAQWNACGARTIEYMMKHKPYNGEEGAASLRECLVSIVKHRQIPSES